MNKAIFAAGLAGVVAAFSSVGVARGDHCNCDHGYSLRSYSVHIGTYPVPVYRRSYSPWPSDYLYRGPGAHYRTYPYTPYPYGAGFGYPYGYRYGYPYGYRYGYGGSYFSYYGSGVGISIGIGGGSRGSYFIHSPYGSFGHIHRFRHH